MLLLVSIVRPLYADINIEHCPFYKIRVNLGLHDVSGVDFVFFSKCLIAIILTHSLLNLLAVGFAVSWRARLTNTTF
jgi:hypothetical protein